MGYGFGFDPGVPAGFQDADIEMRELADSADEIAARLCEYHLVDGCSREAWRNGVCATHHRMEEEERDNGI